MIDRFLRRSDRDGDQQDVESDEEPSRETTDHRTDEWPFSWREDETEEDNGLEVISHGVDEYGESKTFAGPAARRAIEVHADPEKDDGQPISVGIDTKPRPSDGARFAPIPADRLDKHVGIFGASGGGKSVCLGNLDVSIFYKGAGAFVLDGGDEASLIKHLAKRCPPERRDDIVIVDPGADDGRADHATGFNLLHVDLDPGDPGYEAAIDSIRSIARDLVLGDHDGGAIIDSTLDTMIRIGAMTEIDFTIADLRYIIFDEESRDRFRDLCDALELDKQFLDFYKAISEMENDQLQALERRLKENVEDPRTMRVVSDRSSDLSFDRLLREDKLVFFNLGLGDKLKQMLSLLVQQRYWDMIEDRSKRTLPHERDMSFLVVDEGHDVINDNGLGESDGTDAICSLLADGRKKDAGVIICTQRPGQLPESVIKEMAANADTIITFRLEEHHDQRLVSRLLDIDQDWLAGEGDYMARMASKDSDKRERSAAYRFYSLPEYPPFMTDEEYSEFYHAKLAEDGSHVRTAEEIADNLLFHAGSGLLETMPLRDFFEEQGIEYSDVALAEVERNGESTTNSPIEGEDGDGSLLDDHNLKLALQAFEDERIWREYNSDLDGWGVSLDETRERLAQYLGYDSTADLTRGGSNRIIDRLTEGEDREQDGLDPEEKCKMKSRSYGGEVRFRPTNAGMDWVFDQGESPTGGETPHHRNVRRLHTWFTRLGYRYEVISQGGGDQLADATAVEPTSLPAQPLPRSWAIKEIREQAPARWLLGGRAGADLAVEVECKTVEEYNADQVLTNLAKALSVGRVATYVIREHTDETKGGGREPLRGVRTLRRYINDEDRIADHDEFCEDGENGVSPDQIGPDSVRIMVLPDDEKSMWDDHGGVPRLYTAEMGGADIGVTTPIDGLGELVDSKPFDGPKIGPAREVPPIVTTDPNPGPDPDDGIFEEV